MSPAHQKKKIRSIEKNTIWFNTWHRLKTTKKKTLSTLLTGELSGKALFHRLFTPSDWRLQKRRARTDGWLWNQWKKTTRVNLQFLSLSTISEVSADKRAPLFDLHCQNLEWLWSSCTQIRRRRHSICTFSSHFKVTVSYQEPTIHLGHFFFPAISFSPKVPWKIWSSGAVLLFKVRQSLWPLLFTLYVHESKIPFFFFLLEETNTNFQDDSDSAKSFNPTSMLLPVSYILLHGISIVCIAY